MLRLIETLLKYSMKLEKSPYFVIRAVGRILGSIPLWYAERLEKKYSDEEEDEK